MRERPERLYRYCSLNIRSLTNVKCSQLYFNSPTDFNDPFDCAVPAKATVPSLEKCQELARLWDLECPKETSEERFREIIYHSFCNHLVELRESLSRKYGVVCFAENPNNLLMWGHYSSSHTGFCLGFNSETDPFNLSQPVIYQKEIPLLDPVDSISFGFRDNMNPGEIVEVHPSDPLRLLLTKSKAWEYEQEWRLIHRVSRKTYNFKSKSLVEVHFGHRMNKDHREIIALIAKSQNPDVQFFEANLSDENFEMVNEPCLP